MIKKRNQRPNATGRSQAKNPSYLTLKYEMITHKKFRHLSGSAVKVLLEICSRHSGFNNRKIACVYNELEKPLRLGRGTISRALHELTEKGFIIAVRKGYFTGRIATEWEITFLRSEGYEPTDMWKDPDQRPQRPNLKPIKMDAIQQALSDITKQ